MTDNLHSHRCGRVAIVGRPNVGKSTLLNRFLNQKIAIVSPKPETTRKHLLGILTLPQAQILFMDTPGIYRGAKSLLAKHQVQEGRDSLQSADLILFMTEATTGILDGDRQIKQLFPKKSEPKPTPVLLAINKVDRVKKEGILSQIDQARALYPFQEIFPISAVKGDNVKPLLQAIIRRLPDGSALYPADQVTDRPMRDLAADLIREKVLLMTHEEIPHALGVEIEEWRPGKMRDQKSGTAEQSKATYIRATLYVERDSQKGILIGKEGALLKRIGRSARREIEELVEGAIYLDLWVKVAENWRKDPLMLKRLGYG